MKHLSKYFLLFAFVGALTLVLFSPPTVKAAESIQSKAMFNLYSSAVNTSNNSSVTDTGLNTRKTVFINGMASSSSFGNYSGSVTIQCAPTASGPWVTCKDKGGSSAAATTNTVFNLDDLSRYIRAVYARTTNGIKKISVWLFYGQ